MLRAALNNQTGLKPSHLRKQIVRALCVCWEQHHRSCIHTLCGLNPAYFTDPESVSRSQRSAKRHEKRLWKKRSWLNQVLINLLCRKCKATNTPRHETISATPVRGRHPTIPRGHGTEGRSHRDRGKNAPRPLSDAKKVRVSDALNKKGGNKTSDKGELGEKRRCQRELF